MMKSVMIFLLAFSLAACSSDSDKKSDGKGNPGGGTFQPGNDPNSTEGHSEAVQVTDTTNCGNTTPFGYSIFQSGWASDSASNNGYRFHTVARFQPYSMSVEVTCAYKGMVATAYASANASVDAHSVMATTNDSQTTTAYGANNAKLNCTAEIRSGMRINYRFEGLCLRVDGYGLMVPVN